MDLIDNRAIPVTDEQVKEFGIWAKERYGGRTQLEQAIRNKDRRSIEYYFEHTLFSDEQSTAWRKSEKEPQTAQLQLYRRRLEIKISRTSTELARQAFPMSEDSRRLTEKERLETHKKTIEKENYWHFRGKVPLYSIIYEPTAEEEAAFVPSECGICLAKHTMQETCTTRCGHIFGIACFKEWEFDTCPTCSEIGHEVTVNRIPVT